MELRVHLLSDPGPEPLAHLQARLDPSIRVTAGDSPAPDIHILVAGRPKSEHVADRPALRALVVPWAGLPEETRALMRTLPDVSVHNLHYNAPATAEMAAALLLAAARRVVPVDRTFRTGDWTPRYAPDNGVSLHGRTALLFGYGAIGRRLGEILRALGMTVLAIRRRPAPYADSDARIYGPADLSALLPRADALVVCAPLTDETRGKIGEPELALLPRRAILVNIARAEIVQEEALYRALREGRIFGAGLDVWYRYPKSEDERSRTPPSTFPFHELDNVVMSPHRGWLGGELEILRMEDLARLLNPAASGEAMANRVDLESGY